MSNNNDVEKTAEEALKKSSPAIQKKQVLLWIGALVVGSFLGLVGNYAINEFFNFIATVFTRMFQFIAIPTIALAIITTLSTLGESKNMGRVFAHTIFYTLG